MKEYNKFIINSYSLRNLHGGIMKKINSFLLYSIFALSIFVFGCKSNDKEIVKNTNDIIILYENDVHCAVEGYAKLSAFKNELKESYEYVDAVSVGDFIQGDSLGSISQGKYIVDLMNLVGYGAITLGNHEFDYKIPRLMELYQLMETKPVTSNFIDIKNDKSVFQPYTMVRYGEIDIAYVGITTPSTISNSSPSQFLDEEGNYIYSFAGEDLYSVVQNAIDSAKDEGAEYIVALSHLGTEDVNENWSAQSLVKNTSGFDVVLDGHSHSVVESLTVKDKSGKEIKITSTGTKFANIGKLTISNDGIITTELIPTEQILSSDSKIMKQIEKIKKEYNQLGTRKIGTNLVDLIINDTDGKRIIRNAETNLGDFCADAFRITTGADIGFINGGGIRAELPKGEITFNSILSVFPFNNTVCVAEVLGQDILDFLELCVMSYPNEDGSFQHVSGLTFELDSSVPSSVVLDTNEVFVEVSGKRRVSNVKVLNPASGNYEDLQVGQKYTIASHNYLLLDRGSGASMFDDVKILANTGILDVEMLEDYITEYLDGKIGNEYSLSQNRIKIK